MTKEQRQFSAEEKVAILRKHLVEKRPISDVSNECGIRPTQFYQWQKTLFEGDRPPLTRAVTASSSDAATRRSRVRAFASIHRCRWPTPGPSWPILWTITIPGGCTVRSVT